MKKHFKIMIFVISLFLFTYNVKADYKVSTLNPSGAKCELYSKATGFCYYSNTNFNSYVSEVVWMDTGDEMTVLTNYPTVESPNKNLCPDYYLYTSFKFPNKSKIYYGYYCNAYVTNGTVIDELKETFKSLGFPESYWSKLSILKQAHPTWNFRAINTNLDFNDAIINQNYGTKSLIRMSNSNSYSYLALDYGAFDYKNNYFIPYDDIGGSDPWYRANTSTIAYYLDPRNFLNDMYIFAFETLSYDENSNDESVKASINSIFGNDYLNKYTDTFLEAGKKSLVNPIYLASLSKEEVANGEYPGTAISGTAENFNSIYNFYNIGANSGENPVYNGLSFASNTDESTMRPWNDEYKAIVGGAKWIYNNYVYNGQDTSYFKKFNVVYNYLTSINRTPTYSNYTHQYMQNIMAPSSEAKNTYKSYYVNNLLDLSYTFYIPVYNNMPEKTVLSTKQGWPNNYLSSISINDANIVGFDSEVENYNYYLDINIESVSLDAIKISDLSTVDGLGTFTITENCTKTITVTAQNGNIKKYNISIILTGTKKEEPKDIITTLNNAGIKNNANYLSGFTVGQNIKYIKDKIATENKDATVILKDSSDSVKEDKVMATGDKAIINLGDETRNYEVVIYGDANGDGEINAIDYVRIRKYIMNTTSLNQSYKEAADVNKDGEVNAIDYVRIRKYIMNTATIEQ